MGSNLAKLKKAVENGDEIKAIEIYNKYSELRNNLNANSVINEETLDTYMHLSCKNGMVEFLKLLLYENNGDPNQLNRNRQTSLHKICQGDNDAKQYECMQLILQWHTPSSSKLSFYSLPKADIDVNAKDDLNNTALHYAALNNLSTCVQTLIAHGSYLFVENIDHQTACDLAENFGRKDLAIYLESKMLFSKEDDDKENIDDYYEADLIIEEKQQCGFRIQDLQEEKDKLVLETSELLKCNIFTSEILLKKHEWSKEYLLKSWTEDPIKCCEKCGISTSAIEITASSLFDKNILNDSNKLELTKFNKDKYEYYSNLVIARTINVANKESKKNLIEDENVNKNDKLDIKNELSILDLKKEYYNESLKIEDLFDTNSNLSSQKKELIYRCNICLETFNNNEVKLIIDDRFTNEHRLDDENIITSTDNGNFLVKIICGHQFCFECWEKYLTIKIEEGNVNDIICPSFDCFAIISPDIVQKLVSKETVEKYLHFDLKAFVDSNHSFKWCPYANCGLAVRKPQSFFDNSENLMIDLIQNDQRSIEYSRSVDCGNGHYFCWDCLQEGHEPASCQNWKDWFQKILEIKPEELDDTNQKEELSANYLWLVTNSKRCPNQNCNSPIQKNEGCNHIKCYKCKHDFCWICLEPWKKHSSSTGGYFQCNRYEVSKKSLQKEKISIAEAEESHQKAVELNKFVHYYTRFKNHELSYNIEKPLLESAKIKFDMLIAQIQTSSAPLQIKTHDFIYKDLSNNPSILLRNNSDINNNFSVNKTEYSENGIKMCSHNFNNEEISSQEHNKCGEIINNENMIINKHHTQKKIDSKLESNEHYFIEDAIKELLKSRRILRCSYVYGYFLDTFGHKKFIFEFIQTEFEEFTENLSQIIARPHLKTPKNKIIRLTNLLKRKRIEFLDTITRGLNSFSDTPPTLKKYSRQRWKYLLKDNIQNDDEFKNNIALSLKELNPKNPWIIDKKGRHTNLLALLSDWPELESELDRILVSSKDKSELCSNKNCNKLKTINTLSGSLCNYCSIKCMRDDHITYMLNRKNSIKHNISNNSDTQQNKADSIVNSNDESKSFISKSYLEYKSNDKKNNENIIIQNVLNQILKKKCYKETEKSKQSDKKLEMINNHYLILPYEPIFLYSKQNDIGTIIKNMNNIVIKEKCYDQKIYKVSNFDLKIKK